MKMYQYILVESYMKVGKDMGKKENDSDGVEGNIVMEMKWKALETQVLQVGKIVQNIYTQNEGVQNLETMGG